MEFLNKYFDDMPLPFIITDILLDEKKQLMDFKFIYANKTFAEWMGISQDALINACYYELFPDAERFWMDCCYACCQKEGTLSLHQYSPKIDRHLSILSYPWPDSPYRASLLTDETDLVVTLQELKRKGEYDVQTQILNRNSYIAYCDLFQNSGHFSVGAIFADVNGLKECNDTYGHAAGDQLIQTVVNLIRQEFAGDPATIYRLSGDEFVVLAEDCTKEYIQGKEMSLKSRFSTPDPSQTSKSLASVGSYWEEIPASIEDVVKVADGEMYKNKQDYYSARNHTKTESEGIV